MPMHSWLDKEGERGSGGGSGFGFDGDHSGNGSESLPSHGLCAQLICFSNSKWSGTLCRLDCTRSLP